MLLLPLGQIEALVIGTMPNNPPLSSLADKHNHFIGFEIDLMQGICQRIKLPCTYTPVIMKQIQDDLMKQKINIAIAAYIIPDTPPAGFIFSLPYLPSNARFLVGKDSRINSIDDMNNKLIGVRHGTLFDDLLKKLYGDKVNLEKYWTMDDLLIGLNDRDVDAALIDSVAANYWVITGAGIYRAVGPKIPVGNGYGILANVGQEALIAQINLALKSMMADGSYAAIYAKYF